MSNKELNIKGSVLLLGEEENLVYIDRKMLGACGVKRTVFSSGGIKTARFLGRLTKSQQPAFVFCTGLADMDNLHFLELIRLHPNLADLPVILVMSRLSSQIIAETSRLGSCALLARPYTQKEIEQAVLSAGKQKSRLEPCTDSSMFENTLKSMALGVENNKSSRTANPRNSNHEARPLILGKNLLRQGKHQQAIDVFLNHLDSETSQRASALQGIGEAKAALGLSDKSKNYFQQAAVAYVEEEDFMDARILFAKLAKDTYWELNDNPLYQAGARLIKQGRFTPAAQAFMQGQVLTPELSFQAHAARACQFASDPEQSAETFCLHIEKRNPSLGRQLRGNLLTPPKVEQEQAQAPRSGLWSIFCEVIEVARHTARMNAAS